MALKRHLRSIYQALVFCSKTLQANRLLLAESRSFLATIGQLGQAPQTGILRKDGVLQKYAAHIKYFYCGSGSSFNTISGLLVFHVAIY